MKNFGLWNTACAVFVFCILTVSSPAQTVVTLLSFDGTNGSAPNGGLIQATDGNFYGTTYSGGTNSCSGVGCGTVFKITPTGTLTTLHSFDGTDGELPYAGLVQGSDGNFYGTTYFGGAYQCTYYGQTEGCGTVFKITSSGTLTTLHSFDGADGDFPRATLLEGADGNFYGTTYQGGNNGGWGTIFKITSSGTLTTLVNLDYTDGGYPLGALIQGTDGNFYGTTWLGGANGSGTVFKMTSAGVLTTLASFDGTDGQSPLAVMQASDGNFYGTTSNGGANSCGSGGCGTVYKLTSAGTLSTLLSFDGSDGYYPAEGLVQGTDGNFYGTTIYSGTNFSNPACGTIFKITSTGAATTLHTFDGTDGCSPFWGGGLLQAASGTFYGTSEDGGTGYGNVFSLTLASGPAITFSPTSLSFSNQPVDVTSTAKTVTVTNSGAATLDITTMSITQGATLFTISSNTCGATLNAGKKCTVKVTFTPAALGTATGTLSFTDNASGSPQTVALSGKGVEQAILTPASYNFPKTAVGHTSTAHNFTLKNNLNATLTGVSYSTTGDFAVSTTTCGTTLAAKKSCILSVTFTPTATGTRTGDLTVKDSANDSPQTSSLTGTGD